MRAPWRESWRRRAAWFGLIGLVLLGHALFAWRLRSGVIGWNTSAHAKRFDVTFAQVLKPTAPPPAVPPAPAPRPARAVHAMSEALASSAPASAPEREAAASAATDSRAQLVAEAQALADSIEQQAQAQARAAALSAQAQAVAAAASAASAAMSAATTAVAGPTRPPFEWPPATRLTYTLTGQRGEGVHLYGTAVVEWRRQGSNYQVQFDVHISPLIDQHMYSEGEISEEGLRPRHYDESFSFLLATPRARKIEFSDTDVLLSNGTRVRRLPFTQDGASQFVQFVWMFYNHPDWLKPGIVVHIPLALPNNLRGWNYEVVGDERLDLAFGSIDAVHLKPLPDGPRRPNEYPFDIWTAPSLQYLPVQIVVRVDEHTWALLALDELPLQAAGERPPPPPPKVQPFPPPQPFGER